jgi:hypothetical protein
MTSYFNLNEYSDLNPDLKQNNIIQKNQLWEHFIKYGIHEDREYKKYEKMILNNNYLFDSIYYINTNPDLIENNINTYEKAWEHYILYGIHEGRDCMKNDNTYFFDHDFYAQKYKDLLENGNIVDVKEFNPAVLHIYHKDVLRMLQNGEHGWEQLVPEKVAEEIKAKKLFGLK